MKIVLEPGYDHREELGALFAEYTQMLLEKKPDFGGYLEQQGYDTELDHLRDKYGPPDGCLYLATVDGQAAGCMALRKISDKEAELKRLYVRPQFRHLGVAQKLVDQSWPTPGRWATRLSCWIPSPFWSRPSVSISATAFTRSPPITERPWRS